MTLEDYGILKTREIFVSDSSQVNIIDLLNFSLKMDLMCMCVSVFVSICFSYSYVRA